MEDSKPGRLYSILAEKCPTCRKGIVFKRRGFFKMPHMETTCSKCGRYYDREPGYFLGAMYVSYALGVVQAIITFLICKFCFEGLSDWLIIGMICGVLLLMSVRNYRWSRIIWMHIFP